MSVKRMVKWLNKHVAISMRHRREQHKCSRTRVASFCQGSLSLPASIERYRRQQLRRTIYSKDLLCSCGLSLLSFIALRTFPLNWGCSLFCIIVWNFSFLSVSLCSASWASLAYSVPYVPQALPLHGITTILVLVSMKIHSLHSISPGGTFASESSLPEFQAPFLSSADFQRRAGVVLSPLILFSFCFYHTPRNFLWLLRAKLQFACMVLLHQL